jgi:hypothetical protein
MRYLPHEYRKHSKTPIIPDVSYLKSLILKKETFLQKFFDLIEEVGQNAFHDYKTESSWVYMHYGTSGGMYVAHSRAS